MIPELTHQSRESWTRSKLLSCPVDRGEKSSRWESRRSTDLPKFDLREIENCRGLSNIQVENSLPSKPLKQTQDLPHGSVFCDLESYTKLKLSMEIFEDLSFYCQTKSLGDTPTKIFQNVADELNTPVFEKAPFDFVRQSNVTDLLDVTTLTEGPFNYKTTLELSNIDNVNIEESLMEGASRDIASPPQEGGLSDNYICRGINSNNFNMFNPTISEDIYYSTSNKVTPISTALITDEDEYLPTVGNCSEIYMNNTSSDNCVFLPSESNSEYLIVQATHFETPENSRSASEYSDMQSPPLKLQIQQHIKTEEIDTPQIIDTLTSFEEDKLLFADPNFNIFNFITDKDIISTEPAIEKSNNALTPSPPIQQKRHRTKKDDDDEDYEPPGMKRRKTSHTINHEELTSLTTPRRGRPPKRKESISSDGDCSTTGKYREMRDKNNEASRKSRLKKKTKDREVEEEADILFERNIKLKAQVQELERTVTNFRTNLMQILLKR